MDRPRTPGYNEAPQRSLESFLALLIDMLFVEAIPKWSPRIFPAGGVERLWCLSMAIGADYSPIR